MRNIQSIHHVVVNPFPHFAVNPSALCGISACARRAGCAVGVSSPLEGQHRKNITLRVIFFLLGFASPTRLRLGVLSRVRLPPLPRTRSAYGHAYRHASMGMPLASICGCTIEHGFPARAQFHQSPGFPSQVTDGSIRRIPSHASLLPLGPRRGPTDCTSILRHPRYPSHREARNYLDSPPNTGLGFTFNSGLDSPSQSKDSPCQHPHRHLPRCPFAA